MYLRCVLCVFMCVGELIGGFRLRCVYRKSRSNVYREYVFGKYVVVC